MKLWGKKMEGVVPLGKDPNLPIKNCEECVGKKYCYGSNSVRIPQEIGQKKAASCNLNLKGRGTQVLKVLGEERGISRKKAVAFIYQGKAAWVDNMTIVRLAPGQKSNSVSAEQEPKQEPKKV
jgi:hypothetical protein